LRSWATFAWTASRTCRGDPTPPWSRSHSNTATPGDRNMDGSCEILSVEIGESPASRSIDMGDVGVGRYRLAAAAYRSEFLIGDALHDTLYELWTLAREFFRPSFDRYARGASIAMQADRGLEWLHLPEMVLLAGATALTPEALREALKAMLDSRGHLR